MTAMDDEDGLAARRLLALLREIPEGQVSATARRAGIDGPRLRSLRRGTKINVTITTLERLAKGLNQKVGWIFDEPDEDAAPPPRPPEEPVFDARAAKRALALNVKLGQELRAVVEGKKRRLSK